jgi:hypothetical protein
MEGCCIRIKKGEFFRSVDSDPAAQNRPEIPAANDTSNMSNSTKGKGTMQKIAIILHAEPGTHDAMGRALHAMLYTRELKEAGHDVRLLFDGGGTKWIEELSKGEHPLGPIFAEVKDSGAIAGVCQYCIGAFDGSEDTVKAAGLPISYEYMGHPSIATLVGEGFSIITL